VKSCKSWFRTER